jgi:hypothetical protein
MTTPPNPPGPYGQPNQDPWGQQQSGGGYGQYGQRPPEQPQQPQYGGEWGSEQTQRIGGNQPPQSPPYGQPQQFGQQPQYGGTQQFGQPQYGGGFPPPEPPKKKTGMIVAIVAIAVLVLAGAGVGIYFATKDDAKNTAGGGTTTSQKSTGEDTTSEETSTEETTTADAGDAIDAQPGDCIKVNVASSTNADVETIDCSTPEAIYKVATREETDTGSCPNDQYVSYTEEGQLLLCLQLNVKDGECLEVTDTDDKRADCAAPNATHRVVGVFDGVDDETKCNGTNSTEVLTYPEPALTICLVSPAS